MEFFRQATEEEKKQFKSISPFETQTDLNQVFKEKAEKALSEHLSQKKPFCYRCASLDFQDWSEQNAKEMERSLQFVDFEKMKLSLPDLTKYGDASRFSLVKESDAMEPVDIKDHNNITRKLKIGIHRDFRCNVRFCGISIFLSNDDLNKESTKKVSSMSNKQ